jgi:3-deoxy-manno-octulosonate cytidylyltransferase (CMP-KDO synthetase)
VEQHGSNPPKNVIAIIPARYASTRLPGKLLLPIDGKPLILHTLEQATKASNVSRVIVAADDERIIDAVTAGGGEAVMTSPKHQSGSDRIAEVAANLPEGSIIVNVQGDEPLISPRTIEKAVDAILNDDSVDISTTCEAITKIEELMNFNVVKVVTSSDGRAVYFSRSPIPFPREASLRYGGPDEALRNEPEMLSQFRKHTGLYVYRREYLLKFAKMPQTQLEKIEMLEQLRALENGANIRVVEVEETSIGIDTQEDYERVKAAMENGQWKMENA